MNEENHFFANEKPEDVKSLSEKWRLVSLEIIHYYTYILVVKLEMPSRDRKLNVLTLVRIIYL